MDVDTNSDVVAVEIPDDVTDIETEKRPIMLLLKCLIRNKQNTVMTNHQIIEILKQEFDISIDTCHELEVDIYIRIIKKYLKDWPQWEELERLSSKLNSNEDYETVNKILNNKYNDLKEYLGVRLDIAKPLAKQAVSGETSNESKQVVMEVLCTRQQLNHLIYRKPCTNLNNTIFNLNKKELTRISINKFPFEKFINFWATKITISLPNFILTCELNYKFDHKIVNKIRDNITPVEIIDTRLFYKHKNIKNLVKHKAQLFTCFYDLLKLYDNQQILHKILNAIFNCMRVDFKDCNDIIMGAVYRKFCNKYKYVRYLSAENNENTDKKFDLQLEELMVPSYEICLSKLVKQSHTLAKDWLTIECTMCKIKFNGDSDLIYQLESHFEEYHQFEPDWQCTNCKQTFDIEFLAANRWRHNC